MYIKRISFLALAILAGSVFFSTASFARDNNHNQRHAQHDKHRHYERHDNSRHHNKHVRYERDYRQYKVKMDPRAYRDLNRNMSAAYWNKCAVSPGGRYYDCSRTGYNRVNYVVGKPIPRHTVVWQVPHNVRHSLPRPHANTHYVWVDRDILLVDRRDNIVLDIIRAVLN
jgi:Ni/Co efflux regulator RcnB